MKTGIFKLYLYTSEKPYELIMEDNFIFQCGFGYEQWGTRDLVYRAEFNTFNKEHIELLENYVLELFPYIHKTNDIKEIQIEILNHQNPDLNELYTFTTNQIENFNIIRSIDNDHPICFRISFNIIS